MKILVIEDERRLSEIIQRGLAEEGYTVDAAVSGEDGEALAESHAYDAIILDIVLPGKDGIEVCRSLRRKNIATPVLMLTARGSVEDKVKGLDTGADDYLVKPFSFEELLARVRALLRREKVTAPARLQAGDLVMDTLTREVKRGHKSIELTPREYAILEYLMRHPGIVVTRTVLEEHTRGLDADSASNVTDVYIRRLRSRIDEGRKDSLIQTVRGAGYRLKAI